MTIELVTDKAKQRQVMMVFVPVIPLTHFHDVLGLVLNTREKVPS